MRTHSLLAIAFLAGSALAQSTTSTLPKGWDTKDGTDDYTGSTANSYFWAGFLPQFETGNTTNQYVPCRTLYNYDASTFPWDASVGTHIIQKISLRGDPANIPSGGNTKHTKKMVVILSTSDRPAANANFNHFNNNHGKDRQVCFGTIGTGKDVTFPATTKPTTGPAPFDVVIQLDKLFIVPKGAKTLHIEFRAYSSNPKTGVWYGDAVRYSGTGYSGGAYALHNTDHCVSPSIFYTSRLCGIGSNFGHIWRQGKAPGGKTVLTWLGPQNTTLFKFPGTNCNVHVYPILAIRSDVSETTGSQAVYIDWGTIPYSTALVGASISHQSMFVDSSYTGGVGLTRGGKSTVGSGGYDPKVCPASASYSFGNLNSRYVPLMDADKEVHPRYLYRRVPVMKIN